MSSTLGHSQTHAVRVDPHWKNTLESSAIEVFSMMVGVELETFAEPPQDPRGEQTAMVGLAGALCGMVTVRCDSKTASELAALAIATPSVPYNQAAATRRP